MSMSSILLSLTWGDMIYYFLTDNRSYKAPVTSLVKENIDVWNKYTFTNSIWFSRRELFSWNKKEKKRKH